MVCVPAPGPSCHPTSPSPSVLTVPAAQIKELSPSSPGCQAASRISSISSPGAAAHQRAERGGHWGPPGPSRRGCTCLMPVPSTAPGCRHCQHQLQLSPPPAGASSAGLHRPPPLRCLPVGSALEGCTEPSRPNIRGKLVPPPPGSAADRRQDLSSQMYSFPWAGASKGRNPASPISLGAS